MAEFYKKKFEPIKAFRRTEITNEEFEVAMEISHPIRTLTAASTKRITLSRYNFKVP